MLTSVVLCILVERSWSKPEVFTTLRDSRLTESSGVAASKRHPGSYYTHNDSGDTARFFLFDKSGIRSEYTLTGVKATDWEDMASASLGGQDFVYLGDIGDNSAKRASISVYRVPEPDAKSVEIKTFDTYKLTYPDGAHNCETLIVDPKTGDLMLVTKSEDGSTVYWLKKPGGSGTYRLKKLGSISPNTGLGKYGRLVTAGSADRNGKHVIIRTYSAALEYTISGKFQDWWKASPNQVEMPLDPQGEAICYSLDGTAIVTTTEGKDSKAHWLKLQK